MLTSGFAALGNPIYMVRADRAGNGHEYKQRPQTKSRM
jgi:hypothetical protein